jgi:hypothetical protein
MNELAETAAEMRYDDLLPFFPGIPFKIGAYLSKEQVRERKLSYVEARLSLSSIYGHQRPMLMCHKQY